jgi:hypothetical protein
MHLRAPLISTAILALTALLLAGCGGSSNSNSTGAGAGGSPQSAVSSGFKYATCMRKHGVANFPDPVISSSAGGEKVTIRVDPSITGSPAFNSAQKACSSILPAQGAGPDNSPQHTQDLVDFAKCMRAHRVPSFPDPDNQGRLTLQMLQAANIDLKAPAVQAAATACLPASNGAITAVTVKQAEAGG